MEELKPCPFCGGDAELETNSYGRYYVECSNYYCKIRPSTFIDADKEKVIEDWNERD